MPAHTGVFLNVTNIEKAIEFYKSLGFTVAESNQDDDGKLAYATLELDGAEIELGSIAANDDDDFQEWVSTPLGAGVLVYFYVDDVEKLFKKAQKARVTLETPLTDRPYGTLFVTNDPDGYSIMFMTPSDGEEE